jgi:hypothetical protein
MNRMTSELDLYGFRGSATSPNKTLAHLNGYQLDLGNGHPRLYLDNGFTAQTSSDEREHRPLLHVISQVKNL